MGSIVDCNGKNACGDPNFTAAVCPTGTSCGTYFMLMQRGLVAKPGENPPPYGSNIETPYVSYNLIRRRGWFCLPCCILDENVHPKMNVCSNMPTDEDICNQYDKHGICGITFDP